MECPGCSGKDCKTCNGTGTVPDWLADPKVNGQKAATTWRKKR